MPFSTDAPHWSLWMLDQVFDDLVMPDDLGDAGLDLDAGWTISEANSNASRSTIQGSLDLSLRREQGLAQLVVVQETPMSWGMSVETTVAAACRDDRMLRPLRWTTDFVTRTSTTDVSGTSGSSRGYIRDGTMVLEGLDATEVELPGAELLTSSWGLLAALPRLSAAGIDRVHATMLEELAVVRPDQRIERFGEVELELGGTTWELTGWRHHGTGQAPIHYWLSPGGWPMLVCGLRKAMAATYLSTSVPEEGP